MPLERPDPDALLRLVQEKWPEVKFAATREHIPLMVA